MHARNMINIWSYVSLEIDNLASRGVSGERFALSAGTVNVVAAAAAHSTAPLLLVRGARAVKRCVDNR